LGGRVRASLLRSATGRFPTMPAIVTTGATTGGAAGAAGAPIGGAAWNIFC
jgi:hypothetical protein